MRPPKDIVAIPSQPYFYFCKRLGQVWRERPYSGNLYGHRFRAGWSVVEPSVTKTGEQRWVLRKGRHFSATKIKWLIEECGWIE